MLTGNDIVPHPTLRILTLRSPRLRAISLFNSVRRLPLHMRTQHFLTVPVLQGSFAKGFLLLDVMTSSQSKVNKPKRLNSQPLTFLRQFSICPVYETSLCLSIIFHSHAQTTAILSPLLPDLYLSVRPTTKGGASSSLTVLLASLHSLERHYPSQRAFFDLSKSLPPSFTLRDDHQVWLRDLSCSLR